MPTDTPTLDRGDAWVAMNKARDRIKHLLDNRIFSFEPQLRAMDRWAARVRALPTPEEKRMAAEEIMAFAPDYTLIHLRAGFMLKDAISWQESESRNHGFPVSAPLKVAHAEVA